MLVFKKARMPIKIAADALGMDCQTIRVMIQLGVTDWGKCWKSPGSKHYQYLISPAKFFEETGYLWRDGLAEESDEI